MTWFYFPVVISLYLSQTILADVRVVRQAANGNVELGIKYVFYLLILPFDIRMAIFFGV